jgi:PmbA protein
MTIDAILKRGLEKGLEDLQIYSSRNQSLKITIYKGRIDEHVESDVQSVSLRGIYNGKITSVSFENLSDSNVDLMLDQLIDNARALTADEPAILYEGSESYPEVKPNDFDFKKIPIERKINLAKDLEALIDGQEYVKQVQSTVYQESLNETIIRNSKGLDLKRKNSFAYAYAIGVFEKGEDTKTAYDIKLAKSFDEFNVQEMAQKTLEEGWAKLGGRSVPSKQYPVVISNERFSDLLGAFTSLFSGEAAYRNLSPLKDKVGEKIANPHFELIDDPMHEKAYFQIPFDDEGVACYKMPLIEKGVFKGFFHDLKTASIFKQDPNGHSFSGSIGHTNLYLNPGDQSFDELIKPIGEGIYITELAALHAGVKAVSGDFSLQAGGFKIENGKVTTPVKMIVLSGNFFEMINQIEGIADDLKFGLNNIGSPSVYVSKLSIGGDE